MKKKPHIVLLGLATLALLLLPLLPHHHHQRAVCMLVEQCAADGVENDAHTHHGDDGTKCLEVVASPDTLSLSCQDDGSVPLSPSVDAALASPTEWYACAVSPHPYPSWATPLARQDLPRAKGLRGPPAYA